MQYLKNCAQGANHFKWAEQFARFETSYKADSVAKLCQADCAEEASKFDKQHHLLNCPNGTLDLQTGALRLNAPKDLLTKELGAHHDRDAKASRFESFILEICNGDTQLAKFLQKVAGYSLEGGNPENVMFILHGNGANGKSTFVEVISAVMGDYAKTAPSSVLVESRSGSVGE